MRNPTIRDVATRAGVGVGTVSRVLNNSDQVTPETRARVMDAIQKLGYKPSLVARQLSLGTRVQNVGVIGPFVNNYFFVERLRGVQQALTEHQKQYELVLYNISSRQRFRDQLQSIVQLRLVEGLLILTLAVDEPDQAMLREAGIAFAGLNDYATMPWPFIGLDNRAGGRLATQHLLDLGHTRIAYVGDVFPHPMGFPTSEDRYAGYADALGSLLNPVYVRLGKHGRDVAQQLTAALLNLPEPPTAIFAMSDIQALGCLAAVREAGLRVPEDISVIGFDDIEISHYVGLTTVRQHLQTGGYLGMRYLLHLLNTDAPGPLPILPELTLIQRLTTASPAN
jgi:LacI family transcriptional regulator